MGDCKACHTARAASPSPAACAMPTPFGTIYSTNITPIRDRHRRLVGSGLPPRHAQGVDRDRAPSLSGLPLRPFHPGHRRGQPRALRLPDDAAPVAPGAAPTSCRSRSTSGRCSPAGTCSSSARALRARAGQSAEWNRGAYLAEGLGHCGACHTPRNALGAERRITNSPAAMPRAGTHRRSMRLRRRQCRGSERALNSPILRTAGRTSRRPGARWRRWRQSRVSI